MRKKTISKGGFKSYIEDGQEITVMSEGTPPRTLSKKSTRPNPKTTAIIKRIATRRHRQIESRKNRTKRARSALIKKYRNIGRFAVVLAHGGLFEKKNTGYKSIYCKEYENNDCPLKFTIPQNIRLFMFTNPRKTLDGVDAYYIINQLVEMHDQQPVLKKSIDDLKDPTVLVNKQTKQKFYPEGDFHSYEPNAEITNMSISFDNIIQEFHPLLNPKIMYPDGKVEQCSKEETNENCENRTSTTLEKVIEKISKSTNPDEIINVMFLSCKVGEDYYDIENLTQDMKQITLSQTKKKYTSDIWDDYYYLQTQTGASIEDIKANYFNWINENFEPPIMSKH